MDENLLQVEVICISKWVRIPLLVSRNSEIMLGMSVISIGKHMLLDEEMAR